MTGQLVSTAIFEPATLSLDCNKERNSAVAASAKKQMPPLPLSNGRENFTSAQHAESLDNESP